MVLTNRGHISARSGRQGPRRHAAAIPYEIRDENEYFDDIQDVKITKEMLDLARHIVEIKSADFEPDQCEDRYENALVERSTRRARASHCGH